MTWPHKSWFDKQHYDICCWPGWYTVEQVQLVSDCLGEVADRTLSAARRDSQDKFVSKLKADLASHASFAHKLAKGPQPMAPSEDEAYQTLEEQTTKWEQVWTDGSLDGCRDLLQAYPGQALGVPTRLMDRYKAGGYALGDLRRALLTTLTHALCFC